MNRIAPGYNPATSLLVPQPRAATNGPNDAPETLTNAGVPSSSAAPISQAQENAPEDAFLSLKI